MAAQYLRYRPCYCCWSARLHRHWACCDCWCHLETGWSGEQYNVTVGKNEKGYDAWNAIEAATTKSDTATNATRAETPRFSGDRESKDEREAKQRYIIRQSSLSNAVALLTVGAKTTPKLDEVIALAEELVKFVYEVQDPVDLFNQPNDLDTDIPY